MSLKLIEAIASLDKVCEQISLPVQSGSDDILKAMRRGYTTEQYRQLVSQVRRRIPGAALSTDVIVGFPGETDEEFSATRDFIAGLPFSYLHVFTYSERAGTPAAALPEQVDYPVRKARNHVLREISEQKREAFAESMVGRHLEVVVQREDEDGTVRGVSDNYLEVTIEGASEHRGEVVAVRITSASEGRLYARSQT
jgi:threonylcarbamoyladenosine tRNA methylthiotransferase MtaB